MGGCEAPTPQPLTCTNLPTFGLKQSTNQLSVQPIGGSPATRTTTIQLVVDGCPPPPGQTAVVVPSQPQFNFQGNTQQPQQPGQLSFGVLNIVANAPSGFTWAVRKEVSAGSLQVTANGRDTGRATYRLAHSPQRHGRRVTIQVAFVVRAEFLRGRNLEYVKAARALGLTDRKVIVRHILPNAMNATLSYLPFILTGAISTLTALDFLGFGMPAGSASLGELIGQGKQNLQAPWLGLTAFFTLALILSLLVFIGEALRDAFDPRS